MTANGNQLMEPPTSAENMNVAGRLAAIAVLLAAASAAAGLFVPELYRDADAWIRQARAADLMTLVVVVPTLVLSLWRARAGSDAGRVVATAALGYLAYNYAIFGFSVAINPMTPLHIAVLGLSVWSLALSIASSEWGWSDIGSRLPRRTTSTFLLAVVGLFALLWLGQIAQAIVSGTNPEELRKLGLPMNPVYTLDLAFALPFLAVAGVRLLRGSGAAGGVATVALVWAALMGLGVLTIFAFDAAAGAPLPVVVAGMIALITAVGLGLAMLGLRPELRVSVTATAKA